MKKCPKCGAKRFNVTAHVCQDWVVDCYGQYLGTIEECSQVTHDPDDNDMWTCATCGHHAIGSAFEVSEDLEETLKEKLFEVSQKNGWAVSENEVGDFVFRRWTAGEVFEFKVCGAENVIVEAINFADGFDEDAYVKALIKSGRTNRRVIAMLKEAELIENSLRNLSEDLLAILQMPAETVCDNSSVTGSATTAEEATPDANGCTKILVEVKGGLVSRMLCSNPNAEVVVNDLDIVDDNVPDIAVSTCWGDGTPIETEKLKVLF